MRRVVSPVLAIFVGVAEALFKQLTSSAWHGLGCVFLRLKIKEWMGLLAQQVGDIQIERSEELIGTRVVLQERGIWQANQSKAVRIQSPANQLLINRVLLNIAVQH